MGGVVEAKLIKMCLSGYTPSGHARSDPIIHQSCPSDHIHTFYGPQNFHPQTSYEDMRDTPSKFSTTPFVENQSLYWHPTIYRVTTNNNGKKTYIRAETTEMTPYYRWDDSKTNTAFPPKFRMIAHSNDDGADRGQLDGEFNLSTECCQYNEDKDEVECDWWTKLHLPRKKCDYLEIVFAMPTCWNGESLGDDNDHKDHMRYTINGRVDGPCPNGYPHRFPQIQVTMSIIEYQGGTYQLSDEQSTVWHVDFFNGWKEDTLQDILDNCEATKPDDDDENLDYNPPCSCTPEEGIDDFLTFNENNPRSAVCDVDVLKLIIDEAVDVVSDTLPRGTCQGSNVIPKSWTEVTDDLYQCKKENVCVDTTTTFSANKRKRSCSWVEKRQRQHVVPRVVLPSTVLKHAVRVRNTRVSMYPKDSILTMVI